MDQFKTEVREKLDNHESRIRRTESSIEPIHEVLNSMRLWMDNFPKEMDRRFHEQSRDFKAYVDMRLEQDRSFYRVFRDELRSQGETLKSQSETLKSHGEILKSQSEMLNSHSEMLKSHGELLKSHSETLKSHGEMLKSQAETLKSQGETLKDHGQHLGELRAGQQETNQRLDRIEEHFGLGA